MHKVAFKHDDQKTEKYKVKEDDTLDSIVGAKCKEFGDWKALARFNIGTDKPREVNRWLDETVGIKKMDELKPNETVLKPAAGLTAEILIPKTWTQEGFEVFKTHEITLEKVRPPVAISIDKLDKWFIPREEECDIKYSLEGLKECADKVQLDVFGSNYCECTDWNNGLGKFDTKLPDEALYVVKGLNADERSAGNELASKWKGKVEPKKGVLSHKTNGEDRHINVAFSPYTIHLRYFKDDEADAKARISLESFWPQFEANGNLKAGSLTINWEVKETDRLKRGRLLIFDKKDKIVFRTPLPEGKLAKGKQKYDKWDGSYLPGINNSKGSAKVIPEDMPYRVQIHAHAKENEENGLALAAMHTEVRLYVHKETYPESKDKYDPLTDKVSLDFSIADVYHKDKPPERSEGSLWTKYKLAEAGFHPGPVNDGSSKDHFKYAVSEFRRSVPKGGGKAPGPFVRMAPGGDDDDTKDALENLEARRKRPWFGKPAESGATIGLDWRPGNWDIKDSEFLERLRDPKKRMIIWVDDRNWYTNGKYWEHGFYDGRVVVSPANLKAVHDDPADLGGATSDGRGSFEDRDDRVTYDERDVARPWIPLQVDFRLLGKGDELDTEVATPDKKLAEVMRKAIGPIRVDWTFDEIERTSTVTGVKEDTKTVTDPLPELDTECDQIFSQLYHPSAVRSTYARPVVMRTRMALRWALNELRAEYDRQDVKRKSLYFNAPEKHGGIRPDSPAGAYFKAAFGLEGESLLPWTAKPDDARESVCTAVHDDVGQSEENVFAKRIGRAGIYLHPSRMAGDGYQVRAQARFDTKGPYAFVNADVLGQRYERWPQAHTAQFRLWRKTSIRGYVQWAPAGDWATAGDSCFDHLPKTGPDQWRAYYTACHLSIENELGATNKELIQAVTTLFPDEGKYKELIAGMLETGDPRKKKANRGWMSLSPQYVWPWSGHELYGVSPNMDPDFGDAVDALNDELQILAVTVSFRLSMAIVNAIEAQTGRMRGHVLVQFQTTESCHFRQYDCPACHTKHTFVQKSDQPILNLPCSVLASHGTLTEDVWFSTYECSCGDKFEIMETSSTSKDYDGDLCDACKADYIDWKSRRKKQVTDSQSTKEGKKTIHGLPSPSCGFPGGVFWNFVGDAYLWGHEIGHNRHLEHSADAPQKGVSPQQKGFTARPHHDNAENSLPSLANEANENKGWDRACLMSYINQVVDKNDAETYDPARDLPCFCFKCALKNRGWKVAGLPTPKGDLQDVAGV
jgi:hypothetical protein